MDFFPERTVMRNVGLTELPGKIDLFALMCAEEFDVPFFDIAEKTAPREDRFDILGQVLDRVFERVDTLFQVIFLFQKPVRTLGRANKLMHKKKVVSAAVGLFFCPKKLQAFFKLRQQRISLLKGKDPAFFLSHRFVLLTG